MLFSTILVATLASAQVREGCQSPTVTEHALRQLVARDWNRIRLADLQDLWPYPLTLRERVTVDGDSTQPAGPEDGIFLFAYEGRVIAGEHQCADYAVVDQRVGRERGLTLLHLVRMYATAEEATQATKALLIALGEPKGSPGLDAKVVARLGTDMHGRLAIHGTEAQLEAKIGCKRAGCTLELFVSR
jgi:hypothetical protein